MFNELFHKYEHTVVKIFGYEVAIHLEECVLVLAGIFLGGIIMALLSGNFIRKLYKIEDFGQSKVKLIRISEGSKSKYIIGFKSFAEAFQQVLLLAFSPLFTIKHFTKRDEKRTRLFLVIMGIIATITIIFAVLSICTVFEPI